MPKTASVFLCAGDFRHLVTESWKCGQVGWFSWQIKSDQCLQVIRLVSLCHSAVWPQDTVPKVHLICLQQDHQHCSDPDETRGWNVYVWGERLRSGGEMGDLPQLLNQKCDCFHQLLMACAMGLKIHRRRSTLVTQKSQEANPRPVELWARKSPWECMSWEEEDINYPLEGIFEMAFFFLVSINVI